MSTKPTIPTEELVERQFARLEKVEDALANGAHFADDAECHPLYPVAVAARQILKAHIEALKAALLPFAEFADLPSADHLPDDFALTKGSPMAAKQITMGDCRKARQALTGGKS